MAVLSNNIQQNDRVLITYKNSRDFMKTGIVLSTVVNDIDSGDCVILLDFEEKTTLYHENNLLKIIQIVEIPSGETFNLTIDKLVELTLTGLVRLHKLNFYFFYKKDRWQIESLTI
jgi:hypothetical protein